MSATTLKLSEEMKSRISPLAEAAGVTPHAWMVRALAEAVDAAEQRADFVESALAAETEVESSGKALHAADVHKYLRDRLAGAPGRRPRAIKR